MSDLKVLDGSIIRHFKSLTNFINTSFKTHGDKVCVRYPVDSAFKSLTYSEVDRVTTNLACEWAVKIKDACVVSYIDDHKVDYFMNMIALFKLPVVLFVISPRNSDSAIIHLLKKANSKVLFTSKKYEHIGTHAANQISDMVSHTVKPLDLSFLSSQPLNGRHMEFLNTSFDQSDLYKIKMIVHSSGSTGFPKVIELSNQYLITTSLFTAMSKENFPRSKGFVSDDVAISICPLFHMAGFFSAFLIFIEGLSIAFLKQIPASTEEIVHALESNQCSFMVATSAILEQMQYDFIRQGKISAVQNLKYLFFTASNIKKEVGEWFHKNNVDVRVFFGMSEAAFCMCSNINRENSNWISVCPVWPESDGFYFFEDAGYGYKHLRLSSRSPFIASNVCDSAHDKFDTNDLFIEDPTAPGHYQYVSRRDDILVFDNGENLNPLPLENAIRQSPAVKEVVILGAGRPCSICLIEVDAPYYKNAPREKVLSLVHTAVADANQHGPNYGAVLPQMTKLLPLNTLLPRTAKGSVMRIKAEEIYKEIIEETYNAFINGPEKYSI